MLRRRVDPTATTQVQNQSHLLRDAIGQFAREERVVVGDAKRDHDRPIERWD